jgi:eukaryotic-like serine/threonine-protein kinase
MLAPRRAAGQRNPYLNRVMIRAVSDFYGRRREVAKIFARIGASRPQSVAIVGERRIGKSSLLNYLCHPEIRSAHLEDPDAYTFVLIDLQEQREIGISAFFENLFRGIERALGRQRPEDLPADYEGARRALLRLQEEGRKIILLFDEFDAITRNPNFPEEFFAFLRAVANKYDFAYVTTSGRDLQQLCHAERIADSPFFNIFSNLFLTRFERDEALALIREPSAAAGIPLAAHVDDIIDLGGLFPFFLQMACAAFFEHLAEGTDLDIDRVRASFREEAEPHFTYILEHIDEDQRSVLMDLADGRPVPPSRAYLLPKVRRDGYLLEQNGHERLFSAVFAQCLQEVRTAHASKTSAPSPEITRDTSKNHGASLVGQQIGIYQIQALIGAGGMGEVYRALDTRLGREVAFKVLPVSLAQDADRRARFEREARVLASLNHPHIAAIYGFEEFEGVRGLVLELVDGSTLADVILGTRGPRTPQVPQHEALAIARQIADALEAAHEKGIVHRDLKPANIKVTPSGIVKVLDFGLAKTFAEGESDGRSSHLVTISSAGTREGVIVGTPAYMSPEQSRGQPIDKRADIWAFGCVVYELLTGVAVFAGKTFSDTIAAILEREPDWKLLPPATPPSVQRLLQRCLQKDPKQRLHDIADARIELDDALTRADAPSLMGRLGRLFRRRTSGAKR